MLVILKRLATSILCGLVLASMIALVVTGVVMLIKWIDSLPDLFVVVAGVIAVLHFVETSINRNEQ